MTDPSGAAAAGPSSAAATGELPVGRPPNKRAGRTLTQKRIRRQAAAEAATAAAPHTEPAADAKHIDVEAEKRQKPAQAVEPADVFVQGAVKVLLCQSVWYRC